MSPRIAMVSVPCGPDGVAAAVGAPVPGAVVAPGAAAVHATINASAIGSASRRASCWIRPNVMLSSSVISVLRSMMYSSLRTSLQALRHHRPRAAVHEAGDATESLHHVYIPIKERFVRRRDRVDPDPGNERQLALEVAEA